MLSQIVSTALRYDRLDRLDRGIKPLSDSHGMGHLVSITMSSSISCSCAIKHPSFWTRFGRLQPTRHCLRPWQVGNLMSCGLASLIMLGEFVNMLI